MYYLSSAFSFVGGAITAYALNGFEETKLRKTSSRAALALAFGVTAIAAGMLLAWQNPVEELKQAVVKGIETPEMSKFLQLAGERFDLDAGSYFTKALNPRKIGVALMTKPVMIGIDAATKHAFLALKYTCNQVSDGVLAVFVDPKNLKNLRVFGSTAEPCHPYLAKNDKLLQAIPNLIKRWQVKLPDGFTPKGVKQNMALAK